MFYTHCVGLAEVVAYPLKPPPLPKQQGHIQEKQKAMNQRPWMKKCCLWGERKVSLFHTPTRGPHQFPPQFQPIKQLGYPVYYFKLIKWSYLVIKETSFNYFNTMK